MEYEYITARRISKRCDTASSKNGGETQGILWLKEVSQINVFIRNRIKGRTEEVKNYI